MIAIVKLMPINYPALEMEVVFNLNGKWIQTEIKSAGVGLLEGTATLGLMGTMDIPITEIFKIMAEIKTITNGYKNQPEGVIGFVAENHFKNYPLDTYSRQEIIDKGLIDKEIEVEFTNEFESAVQLLKSKE